MNGEGSNKISLGVPPWMVSVGKAGLWAVLALYLVSTMVWERRERLLDIQAKQVATLTVMSQAAERMDRFAKESDRRVEVLKNIMLAICINTATDAVQRKNCIGALDHPLTPK